MPLDNLVIVRHAARLDSHDPTFKHHSPTPYDTPLAEVGFSQARATAETVQANLAPPATPQRIVVHCSPFLRCVQTGLTLAQKLTRTTTHEVVLRIDAVLGEWQTPDYFEDIIPPPSDNHESLQASSLSWIAQQQKSGAGAGQNVRVDYAWPLTKLGNAGEYGESWSTMYARFKAGLGQLVKHYDSDDSQSYTAIIVTHGAGCNPLLGSILQMPVLFTMGLASFCILNREQTDDKARWKLVGVSSDLNSLLTEQGASPKRSRNNSISFMSNLQDSAQGGSIYIPESTFGSSNQRNKPAPAAAPAAVPDLHYSTSTSTSCSSVVDLFSGTEHHSRDESTPSTSATTSTSTGPKTTISPRVSIYSTSPSFQGPLFTPHDHHHAAAASPTTDKLRLNLSLLNTQAASLSLDQQQHPQQQRSSVITTPTSLLPAYKYASGATTPTTASATATPTKASSGASVVNSPQQQLGKATYTSVTKAVDDDSSFFFLGSNQY